MANNILVLYLDSPIQAWGYQSRFNRRTSLSYPTKSGIIGLICAAQGVPKSDTQTLAELTALHFEILSLSKSSRWIDYHTVGGGYEPGSPNIPRIASSGKPGKNPAVTFREYLSDAKFGVLISGDRDLVERCGTALCNPRWGIWLGRKACIPASPIFQGIFVTRNDAISHLQERSGGTLQRSITDVIRFEDGTDTLPDIPLNFATREFSVRRVCVDDLPQQDT